LLKNKDQFFTAAPQETATFIAEAILKAVQANIPDTDAGKSSSVDAMDSWPTGVPHHWQNAW
jgi:hypothetical protein